MVEIFERARPRFRASRVYHFGRVCVCVVLTVHESKKHHGPCLNFFKKNRVF